MRLSVFGYNTPISVRQKRRSIWVYWNIWVYSSRELKSARKIIFFFLKNLQRNRRQTSTCSTEMNIERTHSRKYIRFLKLKYATRSTVWLGNERECAKVLVRLQQSLHLHRCIERTVPYYSAAVKQRNIIYMFAVSALNVLNG